ncbi:hypothetical protein [Micromonospora arida]|uniref:hypothetical protein n=1 Tax=Micromonospora arida TaxID=2203715 RepID=UPI0033ABF439
MDTGQVETITLRVPQELADVLVSEGSAEVPPGRRSTTWEIVATFATTSATTISLLQGPQTLGYLARACLSLARRRTATPAPRAELGYLEAVGKGGHIRMPIFPHTTPEQVEHLLRSTIFKD